MQDMEEHGSSTKGVHVKQPPTEEVAHSWKGPAPPRQSPTQPLLPFVPILLTGHR